MERPLLGLLVSGEEVCGKRVLVSKLFLERWGCTFDAGVGGGGWQGVERACVRGSEEAAPESGRRLACPELV